LWTLRGVCRRVLHFTSCIQAILIKHGIDMVYALVYVQSDEGLGANHGVHEHSTVRSLPSMPHRALLIRWISSSSLCDDWHCKLEDEADRACSPGCWSVRLLLCILVIDCAPPLPG
jgi:hypothetical protein